MDVSSSLLGNLSMVDIGSEDAEGATTLALNNTKSNDLNSANTGRTPQNVLPITTDCQNPEMRLTGLNHWYQNYQKSEDIFQRQSNPRPKR